MCVVQPLERSLCYCMVGKDQNRCGIRSKTSLALALGVWFVSCGLCMLVGTSSCVAKVI